MDHVEMVEIVSSQEDLVVVVDGPSRRRSFTREYKLDVIKYHEENGLSLHKTARHFGIDRKQVRDWLRKKMNIMAEKKNQKSQRFGKVLYPELEKKLFAEFIERRKEGNLVKRLWFTTRAKQLARSEYNIDNFQVSNGWFCRFRKRFNISYSAKSHVVQSVPVELKEEELSMENSEISPTMVDNLNVYSVI